MEFSRERGVIFIWGRLTILFCQKTVQAGYSSMQTLQKKKKIKTKEGFKHGEEKILLWWAEERETPRPAPPCTGDRTYSVDLRNLVCTNKGLKIESSAVAAVQTPL